MCVNPCARFNRHKESCFVPEYQPASNTHHSAGNIAKTPHIEADTVETPTQDTGVLSRRKSNTFKAQTKLCYDKKPN